MASDDDRITSGSGGNTGGTGGPGESSPLSGAGVGAAGRETQQSSVTRQEGERSDAIGGGSNQESMGSGSDELAHASPQLREAVEGGSNAGGEGPGAVSGKLSSEGTGPAGAGLGPSAGDVGGMGGARATTPNHDNRPPGGVSPLSNPSEQD